jgi:hypothetical protein
MADKIPDKTKIEASKNTQTGYKGGMDLPLDKKMKSGGLLREELSTHVQQVLEQELKNQEPRIKNFKKWQKQYKGMKKKKSYPFPKASNIAHPLTRSDTDALYVRVDDSIHNKKKTIICKAIDGRLRLK